MIRRGWRLDPEVWVWKTVSWVSVDSVFERLHIEAIGPRSADQNNVDVGEVHGFDDIPLHSVPLGGMGMDNVNVPAARELESHQGWTEPEHHKETVCWPRDVRVEDDKAGLDRDRPHREDGQHEEPPIWKLQERKGMPSLEFGATDI